MVEIGLIECMILEAVEEVMGKPVESKNQNLLVFTTVCNRNIIDLLYVFESLEKRMGIPVAKVLENRKHSVMSVENLAKAIVEDFGKVQVM